MIIRMSDKMELDIFKCKDCYFHRMIDNTHYCFHYAVKSKLIVLLGMKCEKSKQKKVIECDIMKDYSKVNRNVSYSDCQNCIHQFGMVECENCNYYVDCMLEKEITEFELENEKSLANFYDRLENEEYPL